MKAKYWYIKNLETGQWLTQSNGSRATHWAKNKSKARKFFKKEDAQEIVSLHHSLHLAVKGTGGK